MTIDEELHALMQTLSDDEAADLLAHLSVPKYADRAACERIRQRVTARMQAEREPHTQVPPMRYQRDTRRITGWSRWVYAAAACLAVAGAALAYQYFRIRQPIITAPSPDSYTVTEQYPQETAAGASGSTLSVQPAHTTRFSSTAERTATVPTQTAASYGTAHSVSTSAADIPDESPSEAVSELPDTDVMTTPSQAYSTESYTTTVCAATTRYTTTQMPSSDESRQAAATTTPRFVGSATTTPSATTAFATTTRAETANGGAGNEPTAEPLQTTVNYETAYSTAEETTTASAP